MPRLLRITKGNIIYGSHREDPVKSGDRRWIEVCKMFTPFQIKSVKKEKPVVQLLSEDRESP